MISGELRLSGAVAGALTTLPVVALGAYGLVAPFPRRAPRSNTLLATGLWLLTVAMAARLPDGTPVLLAGSLVAGFAISLGNIALPTIIKRDYPGSVTQVTSVYTVAVTLGAALASAVVVPIAEATHHSWRWPLVLWAVPAVIAAVAWLPRATHADGDWNEADEPPSRGLATRVWRSPPAWQMAAYFGLQSLLVYAALAWLPTICQDRGMPAAPAGYATALLSLVQAIGSLALPALIRRTRDQRPQVVTVVAACAIGFAGIVWAPVGTVWLWTALLGFGQGLGFALALAFVGLRADGIRETAMLSAMMQGVGYVIAAVGPLGFGFLHDVAHTWTVPVAAALVVLACQLLAGLGAGRNRVPVPQRTAGGCG
ncbi:MFS transporter [Streptomyces griseocarneus]|nr:MFS transporter [Streptomyces griseocarneus]